jgi:hypothetical protein
MSTDAELRSLSVLLARRQDDPLVANYLLTLGGPRALEQDEHLGYIEYQDRGVAVMFQKEGWILPEGQPADDKVFRVDALHFYSQGYEGYDEYDGLLPEGLRFSDTRDDVHARLGEPAASGGGNKGSFKKVWPRWDRYDFDGHALRFQYHDKGDVISMVTLMRPVGKEK